ISMLGTVTSVTLDPNQWVINKVTGPSKDITLGVDENFVWANDVLITPNPSYGIFEISSEKNLEGSIEVYDVSGKLILSQVAQSHNSIDITKEAAGVYYLTIKDKSGNLIRSSKLIKE
ncbi:MAG TPA: T9SS type A sorting domain-containing protein, partial [Bacteroidia bacterium]|nr:T9SS type A sorting domain-containing protein [Bacteroidia bacterium]